VSNSGFKESVLIRHIRVIYVCAMILKSEIIINLTEKNFQDIFSLIFSKQTTLIKKSNISPTYILNKSSTLNTKEHRY
jgi:hypothetical protein